MNATPNQQPRICIIGGGAAGLSAGYFLKQLGYTQITVLEKEERVGGKCLSVTVGGKSFDLGANYITGSYKEVKRLARAVGAGSYTEGRLNAYNFETNQISSLLRAVAGNHSMLTLAWESLRYVWKRWRLNRHISVHRPGYKGIAAHPSLCQPFGDWLVEQKLSTLKTLFQVPLSLMGYGQLTEIPTAYALTYLNIWTFLDLLLAPINPHILGYPRRFTEGYERFWQRVAWNLDVLNGSQVTSVSRGEQTTVTYEVHEERLAREGQLGQQQAPTVRTLVCDYLIVAVPLYLDAVQGVLTDMTPQEKQLFEQVIYDPFIVTTYIMPRLDEYTAATFMIPEPEIGQPFVITRQFADNDLISIYTRTKFGQQIDKETILANNAAFIKKASGLDLGSYYTYSEFPYFPHVTSEVMAGGFYDRLEALQGQNNTFFVGGLMNFELVETIVNYAKHLTIRFFPERNN